MNQIYCGDNLEVLSGVRSDFFNLIYADFIYENKDFQWAVECQRVLMPNGIFMFQTDDKTFADLFIFCRDELKMTWVNTVIMVQEWGGTPRNRFPQKHDYVGIFCKGNQWKWYGDRIQIPKATAGTKLDKKGTGLKTPCSVFYDLGNFSTLDKERIKGVDGKNIHWQKSLKFMNRLLLPFTDEGDIVLDPFAGTGTTGVWCEQNNRHCMLIEKDPEVFSLMEHRLSLL